MKRLLLVLLFVVPSVFADDHGKADQPIIFTIDIEIVEGKAAAFAELVNKMVPAVRGSEPETQHYHYFGSPDGYKVTLLEVYPSNKAAIAHMDAFAVSPYRAEFLSLISIKSFQVVGEANSQLKKVMAPFTSDFRAPIAGFSR